MTVMWLSCDTHLPLSEMLSPKKVQMPRDMVSDPTMLTQAATPIQNLDFTRSILAGKREQR